MTTLATKGIGAAVERLQIIHNDPTPIAVTSLTRVNTVATLTTATPHGFTTGDWVHVAGASPAGYTGKVKVTVTSPTTCTYTVNSTLPTPATGTITVTYVSDASGGQAIGWTSYGPPIRAEVLQLRRAAAEYLASGAVISETLYRFRVRRRLDLTADMRITWTPTWPRGGAPITLAIIGIVPEEDGRMYMWIDAKGLP